MKTIVTIILISLTANLFSQNLFFKRKYTKGHFIESTKRLKHDNNTDEKRALKALVLNEEKTTIAQNITLQTKDTLAVVSTSNNEVLDTVAKSQINSKTVTKKVKHGNYENIVRYNTISADTVKLLASVDKSVLCQRKVSELAIEKQSNFAKGIPSPDEICFLLGILDFIDWDVITKDSRGLFGILLRVIVLGLFVWLAISILSPITLGTIIGGLGIVILIVFLCVRLGSIGSGLIFH